MSYIAVVELVIEFYLITRMQGPTFTLLCDNGDDD